MLIDKGDSLTETACLNFQMPEKNKLHHEMIVCSFGDGIQKIIRQDGSFQDENQELRRADELHKPEFGFSGETY